MWGRLLPDESWNEIEQFVPAHCPSPEGGCPRRDARTVLTAGVVGAEDRHQLKELSTKGFGVSYKTCMRRIDEWTAHGIWQ